VGRAKVGGGPNKGDANPVLEFPRTEEATKDEQLVGSVMAHKGTGDQVAQTEYGEEKRILKKGKGLRE